VQAKDPRREPKDVPSRGQPRAGSARGSTISASHLSFVSYKGASLLLSDGNRKACLLAVQRCLHNQNMYVLLQKNVLLLLLVLLCLFQL
jgi:hypothetical protein